MEYGHGSRWSRTGNHNGMNKRGRIYSPLLTHTVRKISISCRSRGPPPKCTRGRDHLSKPSIMAPWSEFVTSIHCPHQPLRQPYALEKWTSDNTCADKYFLPPSHTVVFKSDLPPPLMPCNLSKPYGLCAPAKRTRVLRHHGYPQMGILCHRLLLRKPYLRILR